MIRARGRWSKSSTEGSHLATNPRLPLVMDHLAATAVRRLLQPSPLVIELVEDWDVAACVVDARSCSYMLSAKHGGLTMTFVVVVRTDEREETFPHASATDAYEHAIRLFEDGRPYVAIRDKQGQEYSSGDFAERYLDPLGRPADSQS